MSKRDLKKYMDGLTQQQIAEQILQLYDKFPDVKMYYDFVFRPNEEKLLREAKAKISNEYFPLKTKRPKLRRSTAQKYIKKYMLLGVDAYVILDIMLYNIEVAQKYYSKREIRYASFYKSILNSYEQAVQYAIEHGFEGEFSQRFQAISAETLVQKWPNHFDFDDLAHKITHEI